MTVERAPQADGAATDRYRTLFDSLDQGFCTVEVRFAPNGRPIDYVFLEVNRAFEEKTGLRDAVGKSMRELAPAHEEHWFEMYGRIAMTGVPERFESRAEALERWYNVYAFRIDEPHQRHVAVLFEDISERKRLEETLRDNDRKKDEFLATLAHELRNPLAPLRNGLQIARLTSTADSPLQRTVDMMDRQLTHLVRLVDDLLDVSRINSGKVELERRRLPLNQILASSVEASQSTIDAHEHQLAIETPGEEILVEGDFDRLTQVFTNLLSNSAKYTEHGGRIVLRVSREGPDAVICVMDNGIGIPRPDLERVFDMFSQVRSHQPRGEGGLGIGLSLARSLVALHGGSISAHSGGPGLGSTFTVRLPLISEGKAVRPPAAAPALQAEHPACPGRRVLIADDNADAASTLAKLLELDGHEVVTTADGEGAVTMTRSFRPDVVFLDLGMPRMDGIEAARLIRRLPEGKAVLLVALTGWGQAADRARTVNAGFDMHLVKPVSASTLAGVVGRASRAHARGSSPE